MSTQIVYTHYKKSDKITGYMPSGVRDERTSPSSFSSTIDLYFEVDFLKNSTNSSVYNLRNFFYRDPSPTKYWDSGTFSAILRILPSSMHRLGAQCLNLNCINQVGYATTCGDELRNLPPSLDIYYYYFFWERAFNKVLCFLAIGGTCSIDHHYQSLDHR